MPHFDTSEFKIYYNVHHIGPVEGDVSHRILCVPGLCSTTDFWEDIFLGRLNLNASLLVFDNLCVGRSSSIPGLATTTSFASCVLQLLDHLGWNSEITVVGHSMGGMISLRLVLLDPQRFSHCILCSTRGAFALPPLSTSVKSCFYALRHGHQRARQLLRYGQSVDEVCPYDENLTNCEYFIERDSRIKDEYPQTFSSVLKQTFAALHHSVSSAEMETLRDSNVDFLIVVGNHDHYVRVSCSEKLQRQLGCEKVELNGSHCVIESNPDEFCRLIQGFLTR
ncbi:hypothetical protein P9112_007361 [Eukaryota sp. TZLM1-RC]